MPIAAGIQQVFYAGTAVCCMGIPRVKSGVVSVDKMPSESTRSGKSTLWVKQVQYLPGSVKAAWGTRSESTRVNALSDLPAGIPCPTHPMCLPGQLSSLNLYTAGTLYVSALNVSKHDNARVIRAFQRKIVRREM